MKLQELLNGITYYLLQGSDNIDIDSISWDSRKVKANSLFICVKNRNVDRHDFASQAITNGAVALVVDHKIDNIPDNITVIRVENTRLAMSHIANIYYDNPSKKFNLIGITGTNGKTSVSIFISKILESLGRTVGVIGTIKNSVGEKTLLTEKINPTTPDSIELHSSFAEMVDESAQDAVIEVSSSALDQHRVDHCDFDIGVFTNLTQDHLEEHGTMENYKKAKMKLFKMCRMGIINVDDPAYYDIEKSSSCQIISYGIDKPADFMAKDIEYLSSGTTFTLCFCGTEKKINLNILGKFNVYNSLAAIASCYFLGLPIDSIIEGFSSIQGVPGRFESVPNTKGYLVVVDYAHSPDSLKNILNSARKLTEKRLLLVFGCGGNRDTTKRPIMGEIAGMHSDFCIITSDNPRKENPSSIIDAIEKGIINTHCTYRRIIDRKTAIHTALQEAKPGDLIVIAGKGHEKYQIIGEETIHFDDVEVVEEYFSGNFKI